MNSTTVNASPSSTVNAPDRTWCLALRVPSTDLPRMFPKKKHVTSRSQYKWLSRQRVRPFVPMTGREGLARLRLRQWTPGVEELELPGKIRIFPPRRRLGIERHTALRAAMARLREHGLTVYRQPRGCRHPIARTHRSTHDLPVVLDASVSFAPIYDRQVTCRADDANNTRLQRRRDPTRRQTEQLYFVLSATSLRARKSYNRRVAVCSAIRAARCSTSSFSVGVA